MHFPGRAAKQEDFLQASIFPQALSSLPGGMQLQLSCAVSQRRRQNTARPRGSAAGVQGDREQLKSLECVRVFGAVTPSPPTLERPRVARGSAVRLKGRRQGCSRMLLGTGFSPTPAPAVAEQLSQGGFASGALPAAVSWLDPAEAGGKCSHVDPR